MMTMTSTEAQNAALNLAQGTYQENIIRGYQRLSGADLTGKALRYSGRYAKSRQSLLNRVKAAGIPFAKIEGKNGFHALVWGDAAGGTAALLQVAQREFPDWISRTLRRKVGQMLIDGKLSTAHKTINSILDRAYQRVFDEVFDF